MSATKKQVGGNHYKKYKIQPVEFAQANELNYCESNIIKYAVRHKDKNGIDDVKKIFILVPNFFKSRDDHTSLPYLSLLGHKLSAFIVKILKKPYLLSDGSNWDVWYRSASEYESILNSYGYKVDFLTEKIFPSLSVSPPLKLNIFSFRVLKDLKYLPLILFRIFKKKHFADKYPYLNMIAYSERE